MPKPVSRARPSAQFDENVGRLDVFVDNPPPMDLAERRSDADRQTQEASDLHWRAEQPRKRLSARVLDQKHRPAARVPKLQRLCGRRRVKLVPQRKLVSEAVKRG